MKYFVYMLDGQVDSKPLPMSGNPSEAPNEFWGIDQLKSNGYLPCEINYDPATEEPDYENPRIYENLVEYIGKPLSEQKRKQLLNTEIEKMRKLEYPSRDEMIDAMWEFLISGDKSFMDNVQERIKAVKNKYPEVS